MTPSTRPLASAASCESIPRGRNIETKFATPLLNGLCSSPKIVFASIESKYSPVFLTAFEFFAARTTGARTGATTVAAAPPVLVNAVPAAPKTKGAAAVMAPVSTARPNLFLSCLSASSRPF